MYVVTYVQCSNCSKTARGVEHRISGQIEAHVGYVVLAHRGPSSIHHRRGQRPSPPNFRFLISKRHIFVNCKGLN